jgi:predicted transcriptional regulator
MTGKDSGFRIRVERDLREKFIELCRAQDRPAAQVIRDFMRQYIAAHEAQGASDRAESEVEANDEK